MAFMSFSGACFGSPLLVSQSSQKHSKIVSIAVAYTSKNVDAMNHAQKTDPRTGTSGDERYMSGYLTGEVKYSIPERKNAETPQPATIVSFPINMRESPTTLTAATRRTLLTSSVNALPAALQ